MGKTPNMNPLRRGAVPFELADASCRTVGVLSEQLTWAIRDPGWSTSLAPHDF
jgi:hypothetical protein